jgi:divalent metal cation (Fe/Co/Zn/Cd) transporter
MKHSRRPATPDHPLGHGRAIYFWSFIVALLLFSLGGLFSLYEGLHKLHDPQPLDHAWLALAILGFGVVAEGMSLWGAMREVEKIRGGQSLWQWFRHTRKSELVVVVGEDMAALGGLALAFAAIGLTLLTGNPVFDALGSSRWARCSWRWRWPWRARSRRCWWARACILRSAPQCGRTCRHARKSPRSTT